MRERLRRLRSFYQPSRESEAERKRAVHAKSVRIVAARRHDVDRSTRRCQSFHSNSDSCDGSVVQRVPTQCATKQARLKERQMADETNSELTPEQMAARIA